MEMIVLFPQSQTLAFSFIYSCKIKKRSPGIQTVTPFAAPKGRGD